MNHFEKLISKIGASEKLTDSERDQMRLNLREYMAWKPVRGSVPKAVPSPFHTVVLFLARPAQMAVALFLILGLGGSGVAFASENTLPGDALYPVKVKIAEPIRVALATTPEAKVNVHRLLATRRIDEAATLANEGRLNSSTEAALAENFTENVTAVSPGTTESDTPEVTTERAVSATSFSTKLAAYENVLAQVDHKKGTRSTAKLRIAINEQIHDKGEVAITDTATASAQAPQPIAMMALNTAVIRKAPPRDVEPIKKAAIAALKDSANLLASASTTLPDATSADAHTELGNANLLAAEGERLLNENDDEGAYAAFQGSLSATTRLEVYTHAAATLNINPFASSTTATSTATTTPRNPTLREKSLENLTQ